MVAYLTLSDGENPSVSIAGRRLVTPLSEMLHEFEETYYVEVATEATRRMRTPFQEFLEHGGLPVNPVEKIEIRRKAKKFLILKEVLYR